VLHRFSDTYKVVESDSGFSRERDALSMAEHEMLKENRLYYNTFEEQRSDSTQSENTVVHCAEGSFWRLMVTRRYNQLNFWM
jgi:hypothetical protein